MTQLLQSNCLQLRWAYERGLLGNQQMPEDTHPEFATLEERLSYFTLPMSLNYQRNSYALWEAAKEAFEDPATKCIFDVGSASGLTNDALRTALTAYKVALQPNKHTQTWHTISQTIFQNWKSIEAFLDTVDHDFLRLQHAVQSEHKKGFPYLSGPKIFHYWSYILGEYCSISLKNREFIQIAPDTHVIRCSVRLGVITETEAMTMSREAIAERWRILLDGTELTPSDMHSPLWFWSRNGFSYEIS